MSDWHEPPENWRKAKPGEGRLNGFGWLIIGVVATILILRLFGY